jgi:hypothetical protein
MIPEVYVMDLSTTSQSLVSSDNSKLLKDLAAPLFKAQRWIKLFGWMMIGNGVLTIFSGWGILICWLPIWMGVLLLKTSKAMDLAGRNGDRTQFILAQQKLKTFFTVNGILMLVGIVLTTILMLIFGGIVMKMMPALMEQGAMMQQGGGFPTGP